MDSTQYRSDGLCSPVLTMRAGQLLGTVCARAGVQCPILPPAEAQRILQAVHRDPTVTIRLTSPADEIPHFRRRDDLSYGQRSPQEVFDRKRDLDVLQRLGLVPGDTRRARHLYELLFESIATPVGICAHDTPGWEGCPHARSGAYERIHAQGWSAMTPRRPDEEKLQYRQRSAQHIATDEPLCVRPHHFMCMACWYAGGERTGPRPEDTIAELLERIRRQPQVLITLVEGCCDVCDCCDGFHPDTGRCVHRCGLIRDYKKDLDVLQRLGLMPGATLPANEFITLLFERISSTREICGYGDGVERSEEWRVCGGPGGNPGYVKSRTHGMP